MSTHSAECSPHTCLEIEIKRRAPSMNAACGWTLIRKTSLLRKINPMMRRSSFTNKDIYNPLILSMNERRNVREIVIVNCKLLRRSQTRINLLFTMSEIPHARPVGHDMRRDVSRTMIWHSVVSPSSLFRASPGPLRSPCPAAPRIAEAKRGGARRDRTDDLMLAKHALSQLSYGPVPEDECICRARLHWRYGAAAFGQEACQAEAAEQRRLVGLGRLELPTSRLSSARSNQLSYKPLTLFP